MSVDPPAGFVATRPATGLLIPYVVVLTVVLRLAAGVSGSWDLLWVAVFLFHGFVAPWRIALRRDGARAWFAFRPPVTVARADAAVALGPRQANVLRRGQRYSYHIPCSLLLGTQRIRDAAVRLDYPTLPAPFAGRWTRGQYEP